MAGRVCCVLLSVRPCRALVDERVGVLLQNAAPGQPLTVRTLLHSEDGDDWEAFGHYVTDVTGTVDVTKDPSLGGTYDGVEPMGLLWSLRPVPGSRPGLRFRKRDVQTPMEVQVSVYQGHQTEGFGERAVLASVPVERWYMAPGVRRVVLTEGGLSGTLFLPPGPGPFPGLLDLWGGGGGLVEYRSALLASRGFASLALDYLSRGSTEAEEEHRYLEAAVSVLQQHPQVSADRIGMMGLSFGTSVALKTAVYSPTIKLRCLVCVSGSHVQPVGGSLAEIFAEYNKNVKKTRYDEENRVIWHDLLLPIPTDPAKKVDVGRLQCPLLLIVGEDDQNWPASESAEDMKVMMERSGNSHLLTVLSYPDAGHLIEPPYSPHTRASNFMQTGTRKKVVVLWGGQTAPHSRAQEDAWRKTLDFLVETLYHGTESTTAPPPLQ
ncbi:acyl-coenzyme A thioesterase 1-like [Centroberyx affinis]|uniref:acyl-coenzyme A thioesterase 1-like n=1 Tax=Centroberyx affinis TaxID=166261 RepID=UPI003A5BE385